MTGTCEVVYFSYSYHPVNRYHVLFYNIERKTFTRVNIVKRLSVVVDTHSSTIWRIWSLCKCIQGFHILLLFVFIFSIATELAFLFVDRRRPIPHKDLKKLGTQLPSVETDDRFYIRFLNFWVNNLTIWLLSLISCCHYVSTSYVYFYENCKCVVHIYLNTWHVSLVVMPWRF